MKFNGIESLRFKRRYAQQAERLQAGLHQQTEIGWNFQPYGRITRKKTRNRLQKGQTIINAFGDECSTNEEFKRFVTNKPPIKKMCMDGSINGKAKK